MIRIPEQDKRITQTNQGNILGHLWASFNLDLTRNRGRIALSPRLLLQTTSNASMTTAPCAFKYFAVSNSFKFWTISGTVVHSAASDLITDFVADGTSGSPTTCDVTMSDMELAFDNLYVTAADTKIYKLTPGGVWSNITLTGLGDITQPRMMCNYGSLLYVSGDGNEIKTVDASDVVAAPLTIGTVGDISNSITWMRATSDRIWIGTLNRKGGNGRIYTWDGVSSQVDKVYRLQAQGALACVIKDDVPYVMDSNGRLLAFNGGSFVEIARLPIEKEYLVNATSKLNNRFIHPNGISLIDGKINLLVSNQKAGSSASYNENFPAGIWEYDPEISLYHKHSISYYDAVSGSITDYGQTRLAESTTPSAGVVPVGALSDLKTYSNTASANGTFMAGVLYYTNASSTAANVFIDDTLDTIQKYGYFITTWIDSQNTKDVWQKIYAKYRQFLNSNDKIVLKYRTTEASPVEISITWSTTSSFSTATDISGYVGYEVEVLQGTGSGKTAHISSVTTSMGNYIATLDDTFTGVSSGTAKARLQAWTKIGEITGQTTEVEQRPIGATSHRIQLKVCFLFTGKDEFHELDLIHEPHQLLK